MKQGRRGKGNHPAMGQTLLAKPRDAAEERAEAFRFLFPLLFFLSALILVPVLGTLADSLYRDVSFLPRKFIGLENYLALVKDAAFWKSLRFTFLFVAVSVPLEVTVGLFMALVLNESFPLRGFVRASLLIPWAIPMTISGRIFELTFNYSYGAANFLLEFFHLSAEPVNWLGSDTGAFAALVITDTWKTSPFAAIILLAGLSSIPGELYDQATVDRATLLQRFFRITLPLLKPVLMVAFLFRTIQGLQIFDYIYVLTRGGPGGSTTSLSLFAYNYFASGDFGYGSAASVILFLIAMALSAVYLWSGPFGRRAP
jgi:multiple sugar transport system permease protein